MPFRLNTHCAYFYFQTMQRKYCNHEKKSKYEILVHLYILRCPEFIYAIFMMINIAISVYVSKHIII